MISVLLQTISELIVFDNIASDLPNRCHNKKDAFSIGIMHPFSSFGFYRL